MAYDVLNSKYVPILNCLSCRILIQRELVRTVVTMEKLEHHKKVEDRQRISDLQDIQRFRNLLDVHGSPSKSEQVPWNVLPA